MKHTRALLFAAFFAVSPMCAYAAEEPPNLTKEQIEAMGLPSQSDLPKDYEIKIDENELLSEENFGVQPDAELQELDVSSLNAHRDTENGGFRYDLPNDTWFSISVPAGGISTGAVSVKLSEDLYAFHAERDGKQISIINGEDDFDKLSFSEVGTYEVTLDTGQTETGVSQVFYKLTIPFQICAASTNAISAIETPPGFHLTGMTRDGEEQPTRTNQIPLEEDGVWSLRFESDSDSSAVYRLQLKLDRIAPELLFSKPIDQGPVRPPLKITALEDDCEILVRDGSEPVILSNNTLTYGGLFRVIARDSCGNERNYTVQISYQIFRPSIGAIIIFVLLAAGLGGYLLYLRRHIQIL